MVELEDGLPIMNEDVREWSRSACVSLTNEYRSRPELWDRNHSLYRVQMVKLKSWKTIAERFSCDVKEVRKKMESILASYRRERAKVKEGTGSNWFLYPLMDFLSGYVRSPGDDGTISHIEFENAEVAAAALEFHDDQPPCEPEGELLFQEYVYLESDATHASEDEEAFIKQEPVSIPNVKKRQGKVHCKKKLTRTLKRKINQPAHDTKRQLQPDYAYKSYVDEKFTETKKLIDKGLQNCKNDCDSFGEYIAATLKKHDEKTQCLMKQAINNILFQQEMKKYDSD